MIGRDDPTALDRRLAWAGLSWTDVRRRLDTQDRPDPARHRLFLWLVRRLEEAPRFIPEEGTGKPVGARGDPPLPFEELWDIVARAVASELREKTRSFNCGPALDDVLAGLVSGLRSQLATLSSAVLWEAYGQRRSVGDWFLEHLATTTGATPGRERYVAFLEELRSGGLDALCRDFPMLARHLAITVDNWIKQVSELLYRVGLDDGLLHKTYGIPADACLVRVQQGYGDTHCGGRTVSILAYESPGRPGRSWKVVYKPKDMRLDEAFQEILRHTALPSGEPPLASLKTVSCDGYGYSEFIHHVPCSNASDLDAFYRYAGRLTAMLHLLGATDCHHENFVASGSRLFLIDSETLLAGIVADHIQEASSWSPQSPLDRAVRNSVLRTGVLPQWNFAGVANHAIDISALGVSPPLAAEVLRPGWTAVNTDAMAPGEVATATKPSTAVPVGARQPNPFAEYVETFCQGFRDQLSAIEKSKHLWTGGDGILARFHGLHARLVIRPTKVYLALLEQQVEPGALRSIEAQGLVLEQLARTFLAADRKPRNWEIFPAEVRQLEQLDVPFFTHAVHSRDLVLDETGHVPAFFECSGLEKAAREIGELSEQSIDFQVGIIRAAVAAKAVRVAERSSASVPPAYPERHPDLPEGWRGAEIRRLADRLVKAAILAEDGRYEWLGVDLGPDGDKLCFGRLSTSPYSGSTGIALFLKAAGDMMPAARPLYHAAALGALQPLLDLLRRGKPGDFMRWWRDQPLGLGGSGGALLALRHLALTAPVVDELLAQTLPTLLTSFPKENLQKYDAYDVLSGLAGLIGALLFGGGAEGLELAVLAGERLLDRQAPDGGWPAPGHSHQPLTGFAHGAGGIAAALARLAMRSGKPEFICGAVRALAYEHALYDARYRNWPDFRHVEQRRHFMLGWCHGAPGIALSRLCLRDTGLWSDATRAELDNALVTTAEGSTSTDRLCCGRFGRSAILRLAGRRLNDPRWTKAADEIEARATFAALGEHGSYRYFPDGHDCLPTPGLFIGDAGVGLVLVHALSGDSALETIIGSGLLPEACQADW